MAEQPVRGSVYSGVAVEAAAAVAGVVVGVDRRTGEDLGEEGPEEAAGEQRIDFLELHTVQDEYTPVHHILEPG